MKFENVSKKGQRQVFACDNLTYAIKTRIGCV